MFNLSKRFTIFASVQSAHSTNIEPHFNKTKTKMKQFYLLLTALFLQLAGLGANAQTPSSPVASYGDGLITDVSQLTSNASDKEEGKELGNLLDGRVETFWHSDWHGEVTEPHYLQVQLTEPISTGYLVMYMQRRDIAAGHLTNMRLSASADGEVWDDLADFELDNASAKAEVVTEPTPITKEYSYVRVTNIAKDPIYFHAAEFQLYNPKERNLVDAILDQVLTKYNAYEGITYESLKVGTETGQFTDKETADKIIARLNQILEWVSGTTVEGLPETKEKAQEISDEMDALFTQYRKSEVLYSLPANGYYRIISGLTYKHDESTGEGDDATTVTTYMKKAMFCSTDYKGMWGTLKDDMANYIWKLTQTEDGIDMVNAGMGARFNKMGATCTLAEDGDKKMTFDFAGNENGQTIIYIRETAGQRNAQDYLHQKNHSRGIQVADQPLCTWQATFNMGDIYTSDKGTSEWYLEPVDEKEAEALITAFEPIKNHDKLVEQNTALRAEVEEAIITAKDRFKKAQITSGEQMTSIWSQNREGNDNDGGNLIDGVLIDSDPNTYWHSIYQNKPEDLTGAPYIQISGTDEMQGDMLLYIKYRITGEGFPVQFTLKGSNDAEAADDAWTQMAVVDLGNRGSGNEFTSGEFKIETPYSNVRIYSTNSTYSYFHAAELQLYKLEDNPNSQFVALGELATNLEKIYKENVATEDADLTIDMYNALSNAYEAFKSGMTDPSEMRKVMAQYADTDKAMVEGTNPGQWANTDAYDAFQSLYNEMKAYDATGRYTQDKLDYYAAALPLAAKNFMAAANAPKTDTWYRIKFPSEALYDANHWDKSNIAEGSADVQTPIWDNYVTVGEYEQEIGQAYFNYWATEAENIREGSHLVALENELTEMTPDASYFRFVEVESPIVPASKFNGLIATSRQALSMATTTTLGEPMIKNEKQLTSNASDEAEGKNIDWLIDGNPSTFWHTDYHGKVTEPHYLQVSFDDPVSGIIEVDMTRRAGANDGDVTRMYVTASNDGQNWDRIGYIEMPFGTVGERILSTPIDLNGSYTSLRFIMTKRRGFTTATQLEKELDPFGEECTYFHAAEFQIRPVTVTKATENAIALEKALVEANKILPKNVTMADYTALASAYNVLQQELNAGTHKVVPAAPAKPVTYALQNKATGLFVNTLAPNDHEVTLRLTPTIFSHAAIGYGENALSADNIDGQFCTYLHVQRNTHQFVTWDDNRAGSNSGLMLEEVEASEENPEFTFSKDFVSGEINAWCYPVNISTDEADVAVPYTVAGLYKDEAEKVYLALDKAEGTVEAGQPILFIMDTPEDWKEATEEAPAEITPIVFKLNTKFNFNAGSHNGLVGTLVSKPAKEGMVTFVNNTMETVKADEPGTIKGNTAYLDINACPQIEAGEHALSILLTDVTPDGINSTLENVSKRGNIYTIDGKLVRANGTLNDINYLGKGLYILNGVKVLVK